LTIQINQKEEDIKKKNNRLKKWIGLSENERIINECKDDLDDLETSVQNANENGLFKEDYDSYKKIVESISGAGYEAAVIAAALEFEKNAVKFYSEHATSAESEQEQKLYHWLTEWEKNHMLMMAKLDNELKEKIWYDNKFWPMD